MSRLMNFIAGAALLLSQTALSDQIIIDIRNLDELPDNVVEVIPQINAAVLDVDDAAEAIRDFKKIGVRASRNDTVIRDGSGVSPEAALSDGFITNQRQAGDTTGFDERIRRSYNPRDSPVASFGSVYPSRATSFRRGWGGINGDNTNPLLQPQAFLNEDPMASQQWYLPDFEYILRHYPNATGRGITIAVADTGVDLPHEDVDRTRMTAGRNVVSDDDSWHYSIINHHGTMTTGLLIAKADNGLGISPLTPQATIIPIRISNTQRGEAEYKHMAKAMIWAADHGADIISFSYQMTNNAWFIDDTIAYFLKKTDGLIFAASGNNGTELFYKNDTNIITVGSHTQSGEKSSFSNWGEGVDFHTPGQGIQTLNSKNSYINIYGTSLATPIAAGYAALIWSQYPDRSGYDIERAMKFSAAHNEKNMDLLSALDIMPHLGYALKNPPLIIDTYP